MEKLHIYKVSTLCREISNTATLNKAQPAATKEAATVPRASAQGHSPLRVLNDAVNGYADLQTHASKLAEALRDIRDCAFDPWQVAGVDKGDTAALSAFSSRVHSVAKSALAAYEAAQ